MDQQIASATSIEALFELRQQWHEALQNRRPTEKSIVQHICQINQIHDAFIRKAISFAEQLLLSKGMASPSVSYAFLVFGSGGRMEQTPWSDQDNGLVYDDRDPAFRASDAAYFQELGKAIVDQLKRIGYPPCEGEVGADSAFWCKSLSAWLSTFDDWFAEPNWENIRYLLITADIRCMHGDERLAAKMQSHILVYANTHPSILRAMLSNTLRHKIVLNVLGQLLVEPYGEFAGCVDVKYGGYIPIINSIRLYAILAGVVETSSLGRLEALRQAGELSEQQYHEMAEAISTMLYLRESAPYDYIDGHYVTSGMVKLKQLEPEVRKKLKVALKTGRRLQRLIEKIVGLPK